MAKIKKKTKKINCVNPDCGVSIEVSQFSSGTRLCSACKKKGLKVLNFVAKKQASTGSKALDSKLRFYNNIADTIDKVNLEEYIICERNNTEPSIEQIFLYLLGIGYKISKTFRLFKDYGADSKSNTLPVGKVTRVSLLFAGDNIVGFAYNRAIGSSRKTDLITNEQLYFQLLPKDIKEELTPLVKACGVFTSGIKYELQYCNKAVTTEDAANLLGGA